VKVFARTHMGKVRKVNEDAYYIPAENERFAIVADGVGGHRAGEVASHLAVDTLVKYFRTHEGPADDLLKDAIDGANRVIYEQARRDRDRAGMGTTLTALIFDDQWAHLAHVGDSRAYLMRNGALMQLSRDHSLVGELLEKGEITAEEARVHPQRNYITRCLGVSRHVGPDILHMDQKPGDLWLMCSDGLSNMITDPEMAHVLAGITDYDAGVDQLVQLALDRGGRDNITVLLILREEDEA